MTQFGKMNKNSQRLYTRIFVSLYYCIFKIYLMMKRFVFTLLLGIGFSLALNAQSVSIEGVKNILAKEDKFDKTSVYLTLGKPKKLKIFTSAKAQILAYKENPLKAQVLTSVSYNAQEQCWEITQAQTSCGYLIKENGALNQYIYLLNYEDYAFQPKNLKVHSQSQDPCRRIVLSWEGTVRPMLYYGSMGIAQKLKRAVELSYKNLVYSKEEKQFKAKQVSETIEVEGTEHELTSSLTDTEYTLIGDQWQKAFALNLPKQSSPLFETKSLEVYGLIKVLDEEGKEISEDDWSLLSAPLTLELQAIANKPEAQRYRWKILQRKNGNKEPETILDYTGNSTEYTLNQAGYYSIILEAFTNDGTCSDKSFRQELRVQESKLEVPNAFSPFDSEGVNDLFKVYAKSLVSFEAHIFAPNGQKLFSWYNVQEGWDGRYRGKEMPMGAYYYVIKAKGADGIQYNKKGVLNLVRTNGFNTLGNQ